MVNYMKTDKKRNKIDKTIESLFFHHPFIGFLTMFIGMPIAILLAVIIASTAIMLLFPMISGWF